MIADASSSAPDRMTAAIEPTHAVVERRDARVAT